MKVLCCNFIKWNSLQVLQDALLENQTEETFKLVNKAKGDGAVALDAASRACCPDLHMWVTFSSVACGRGNMGQLYGVCVASAYKKVTSNKV